MQNILNKYNNFFFIGIGGSGMSAIAQYLKGIGKNVAGSDRLFVDENHSIKIKLQNEGIKCFPQNSNSLTNVFEVVVISTAIENSVPEFIKAKELGIEVIHRADMLKAISDSKKTIAVSGTSGKSTTVAMLFHIMDFASLKPSIISGAGLTSLQKSGKIGNCFVGKGDWLIIEADESDGTLTKYTPEVGVILNIEKDHKEFDELEKIFGSFSKSVKDKLIVNISNERASKYSLDSSFDFCSEKGIQGIEFEQNGLNIKFKVKTTNFEIHVAGKHNMENALAAIAVANYLNINLETCSTALKTYDGIYRRMQKIGVKNNVLVIDDYAHNPAKISAAISACQQITNKVIAWFQPHGFGPTKFLKNEFISEISKILRNEDEIWMSEIYYAGGTAAKDISANDLIVGISANNKKAFFVENRNNLPEKIKSHFTDDCILLLMGARDNSLEDFGKYIFAKI